MSDQLEPRPYSERELTLKAISVTFLRANAAQQRLTGRATLRTDDTTSDDVTSGDTDGGPADSANALTDPDDAAPIERMTATPAADQSSAPEPESASIDPFDAEDPGTIEQAASQDEEQEQQALPNPIVTDANLRHYMDLAGNHQGNPDRVATSRLWRRLFGDRHPAQLSYNGAILHALHQLDHRTRLQQRTITQLEAELTETRRALAELQSDGMRSS